MASMLKRYVGRVAVPLGGGWGGLMRGWYAGYRRSWALMLRRYVGRGSVPLGGGWGGIMRGWYAGYRQAPWAPPM